jgi:hypothetical protein
MLELKDAIIESTIEHWQSKKRALLLSQMYSNLKKRGLDHQRLLNGEKISNFIKQKCNSEIKIIESPIDDKILAVIPIEIEFEKLPDERKGKAV